MPISSSQVSALRSRTGVPILACKEALEEANGNEEKAIEILRKKGIAQAAKKAARKQNEGRVFLRESGGKVAMILLRCETDFVARDNVFQSLGGDLCEVLLSKGPAEATKFADARIPEAVQKLGENISLEETEVCCYEAPVIGTYVHTTGKIGVIVGLSTGTTDQAHDIAMHAAAMNPLYVSPEEVPTDAIEKEKEIWREQLGREGKPPQIIEKIMIGKEKKFREENALTKQPFVKDPTKTVEQHLAGATVTCYVRLEVS